ncbi:MAG: Gx transporter family protein [Oscillospiraceae bacterium]|jgi:heptaprenyl diphosphate synthase|nr:Gx transporter family protein [Oscillospiraceae bacterium]
MTRAGQARRVAALAMLSGIALIIFTIEARLPANIVPIPGVKLGLANIVTLFTLYRCGRREAFSVLIVRVLLGAIVTGHMLTLAYSLSGGLLCLAVCALARPVFKRNIWICSMVGAVFHNIGQLLAARVILKSAAVFAYFPPLLIAGLATGLFTGLCVHVLLPRLDKSFSKISFSEHPL